MLPQPLGICNRGVAGEIAADVNCGAPIDQAALLQEWDSGNVRLSKGHHLEGPVAFANHV